MLGTVSHIYNPSTWETEAGEGMFTANNGCMMGSLKKKKKKKKTAKLAHESKMFSSLRIKKTSWKKSSITR